MPTKTKVKPLYELFDRDLRQAMQARLVERDEEIEILMLAMLAKTHVFFQGEPGIAKTMMVETLLDLISGLRDEDYFEILFMKSTTREDVFGPLSLKGLKDDRYNYLGEGFLPSAKFAFGDEFWKANGAIQNALLWATNERKQRNDGKVVDLPLHTMVIASNEFPSDDSLLAIYDRFPLRRVVSPIREPGNFIAMLKMTPSPKVPIITWEQVEQACAEVQKVVVPGDVLEKLADIKETLKEEGLLPSDRRYKVALDIVRAKAWLEGEVEADVQHLRPLRHVLWSDPDHFPIVDKLLTGLSNPIDLEIMDIMKDLDGLSTELDKTIADPGDFDMMQRIGTSIFEKVEKAMEDLKEISVRLKGSKKRSAKLDTAKEKVLAITKRLLQKVFHMSDEDIEKGNLLKFAQTDDDDAEDGDDA